MPVIAFWQPLFSISTALLIAAIAGTGPADAAGSGPEGGLERCRTIPDDALRLRCFEDATSPPAKKHPLRRASGSLYAHRVRKVAAKPFR
jgi:hypothetical protein